MNNTATVSVSMIPSSPDCSKVASYLSRLWAQYEDTEGSAQFCADGLLAAMIICALEGMERDDVINLVTTGWPNVEVACDHLLQDRL